MKNELSHFSLRGICMHVAAVARGWDIRADTQKHHFRTRHMTPVQNIPNLRRFPYPAQELICSQLQLMFTENFQDEFDQRIAQDRVTVDDDNCIFYRRYQLPCAHILKQDQMWGTIPQSRWDTWSYMWEDSGFEMYEKARPLTHSTEDVHQQIGAPAKQRHQFREAMENLQSAYYRVAEEIGENEGISEAQGRRVMERWIESLDSMVGGVRQLAVQDLLQTLQTEQVGRGEAERDDEITQIKTKKIFL